MENQRDLSEHTFPWPHWLAAEPGVQAMLRRSELATSRQEIVADRVFWRFVATWRVGPEIRNPRAWAKAVTSKELWRERRRHEASLLGDRVEQVPEREGCDVPLPDDAWALVVPHEGKLLGCLSALERRVYECLRDRRTVQGCCERLGMSPRDVRTRLRRICSKLHGILAHVAPPPLPRETLILDAADFRGVHDQHGKSISKDYSRGGSFHAKQKRSHHRHHHRPPLCSLAHQLRQAQACRGRYVHPSRVERPEQGPCLLGGHGHLRARCGGRL
jgi:DNA-binding CsgD family transcriptional regulator